MSNIYTHYIAADYVTALITFAAKDGIQIADLLTDSELPSVMSGLMNWTVMQKAIDNYILKTGNEQLGLNFGLTLDISKHGLLGYAAKSAATLFDAMLIDEQYLATRTNVIQFNVVSRNDQVILFIDTPLAKNTASWRFFSWTLVGIMARLYHDLIPNHYLCAKVTLPFQTNAVKPLNPYLNDITWSDASHHFALEVAQEIILASMVSSDTTLKQLLVNQCAAEMLEAQHMSASIVDLVSKQLSQQIIEPPTVAELSAQLGMSERTLKRKLHLSGTSYRQILKDIRINAATHYLQTTTLTIEQIASRIGYDSPSTFKNQFHKWTSLTPKQMRKQSIS